MAGILYGVGIGPGDPELLTLKAKRILEEADAIVFPGEVPEETIAYSIIRDVVRLEGKPFIGIAFPMTKDKEQLERNHLNGALKISEFLDKGMNVAFPVLGDPSVYSTFTYVNKILKEKGYVTEVIPGITSFCAAAAKVNEALGETSQQIHIIPSSYGVSEAVKLSGTKVLMKAGSQMDKVIEDVKTNNQEMILVENLGMENERIIHNPEPGIDAGYYTLIIVK